MAIRGIGEERRPFGFRPEELEVVSVASVNVPVVLGGI